MRSSIGASTVLAAVAIGALVVGGIWWALAGRADEPGTAAADDHAPFAILPPIGLDGVSPLGDALRVSAEANLQRATWQVAAAGAEVGGYDAVQLRDMAAAEPALVWLNGTAPSTTVNEVSVALISPTEMALAVWAGEGKCGYVRDVGNGVQQIAVSGPQTCIASAIPDAAFAAVSDATPSASGSVSGDPPLPGLGGLDVDRSAQLNEALEPQLVGP